MLLHVKNWVHLPFELNKAFQLISGLSPLISDQVNPLHLFLAEMLASNPLVNGMRLTKMLVVCQMLLVVMSGVEEVDQLCLPAVVAVCTLR